MIIVIDFVVIVIGVIIILICVIIVEAFVRCLDISNWVSILPTSQSKTDTQRILSIKHEVVALSMPCAPATSNIFERGAAERGTQTRPHPVQSVPCGSLKPIVVASPP